MLGRRWRGYIRGGLRAGTTPIASRFTRPVSSLSPATNTMSEPRKTDMQYGESFSFCLLDRRLMINARSSSWKLGTESLEDHSRDDDLRKC